jgi:hypothetical protein
MLAEAVRQVGRPAFRKETQARRWGFMQAGSRQTGRLVGMLTERRKRQASRSGCMWTGSRQTGR